MGNKAKIQDYEHIKHVFLEFEKFTEENKMMTSSRKLARPNIRVKYREILNEMLGIQKNRETKSIEKEAETDEKTSLRKITKYCAALLGNVDESELLDTRTLSLHGLQSLGMQRVKSFLEQTYKNLHIPIEIVGASSVRTLARIVDCSLSRFVARYHVEFDEDELELQTIETKLLERFCEKTKIEIFNLSDDVMSRTIRSVDTMITRSLVPPDKKIDSDCTLSLEDVSSKYAMRQKKKQTVVLTGATGFVGAFVLEEFMKRGFRVVCLVRGESDVKSRERVLKTLEKYVVFERGVRARSARISLLFFTYSEYSRARSARITLILVTFSYPLLEMIRSNTGTRSTSRI